MRQCLKCRVEDKPIIDPDSCNCTGGEGAYGHASSCAGITHYVAKHIKFRGPEFTKAMSRDGWTDLGLFQGKAAMYKLLCRPCIRKVEEVTEIDAYRKKKGIELEQGTQMGMYNVLCS